MFLAGNKKLLLQLPKRLVAFVGLYWITGKFISIKKDCCYTDSGVATVLFIS
jgi:hypothetical protein